MQNSAILSIPLTLLVVRYKVEPNWPLGEEAHASIIHRNSLCSSSSDMLREGL